MQEPTPPDPNPSDHSHDVTNAFTLYLNVVGKLVINIALLAGRSSRQATVAAVSIVSFLTAAIGIFNGAQITKSSVSLLRRYRGKSQDQETAHLTETEPTINDSDDISISKHTVLALASKILVTLGSLSYYIGNNLPGLLKTYGDTLGCDAACVSHAEAAGYFLTFLALTTFTFIPSIFAKLSKLVDRSYNENRTVLPKHIQLRQLLIRMMALALHFDAIYSGLWIVGMGTSQGCQTDMVVSSITSIVVGWVTWGVYGVCYHWVEKEQLQITKHLLSQILYYGSAIVFLVTFFPIHVTSNNDMPLSCACDDDNSTITFDNSSMISCEGNTGVLSTRIVLLAYQLLLLTTLGIMVAPKPCVKAKS